MFKGKKILVVGVANDKSISWAIAEELAKSGAELCFTYVNEAIEKRVRPLAASVNCEFIEKCDVSADADIDSLYEAVKAKWGTLDGIVHGVAFANKDELDKDFRFSKTSRKGFATALDVSAFSLISLAGKFESIMNPGGSIITLTYLGAERVVKNYNVMGVAKAALECSVKYLAHDLGPQNVRVNAISAGPIRTLAASGIGQFKDLHSRFAEVAPLRRNVSQSDVAGVAKFYLSDLSSGVTGEITYVDAGFNTIGA